MLEFLSRHGVKISQNEPCKASWKFGWCNFLATAMKSIMDKGGDSAEHWATINAHADRQRTHSSDETLRDGFHGEKLVGRPFYGVSAGGGDCGNAAADRGDSFPAGRTNRQQHFHRAAPAPAVCDLPRPAASRHFVQIPAGRRFHESFRHPVLKP